jgi:hypothetical protein
MIEAPWLVNGVHGASLRHHYDSIRINDNDNDNDYDYDNAYDAVIIHHNQYHNH